MKKPVRRGLKDEVQHVIRVLDDTKHKLDALEKAIGTSSATDDEKAVMLHEHKMLRALAVDAYLADVVEPAKWRLKGWEENKLRPGLRPSDPFPKDRNKIWPEHWASYHPSEGLVSLPWFVERRIVEEWIELEAETIRPKVPKNEWQIVGPFRLTSPDVGDVK